MAGDFRRTDRAAGITISSLKIVMNGVPGVVHLPVVFTVRALRSETSFSTMRPTTPGIGSEFLSDSSQVTLPPGVVPQMGTDWSPVGQIYFFTLHSSNPAYERDGAEVDPKTGWSRKTSKGFPTSR